MKPLHNPKPSGGDKGGSLDRINRDIRSLFSELCSVNDRLTLALQALARVEAYIVKPAVPVPLPPTP
jgi:hypothetical protein